MARDREDQVTVSNDALATALGAAMAQALQAVVPPRELKEGDPEYVERLRAEGFMDSFDVPVFQNAYEANPRGLSEETRKRASTLRPGKYLKGRVNVEVDGGGVRIKYPVSGDNGLKNMALWRDFPDLVNQIWAEMESVSA